MEVRSVVLALACSFLVSIAASQDSSPPQHLVQDWSTHHVVFTGLTPRNVGDAVRQDPRAWHSWLEHGRYNFDRLRQGGDLVAKRRRDHRHRIQKLKRDWQMPTAGSAEPWSSPAKFNFDVNGNPDCTNDFVVFPTGSTSFAGTTVQASIMAFNNLYTGPGPSGICPSPTAPASQPSVLFAYNTTTTSIGSAPLSPVLSLDGKKIGFVENGFSGGLVFHVLTWKAGEGTNYNSAALPGDCSPGNSCLTSLTLSTTSGDSRSNPFVDYAHDTAYVGDGGGFLHKITPVFNGVPQEITSNGWPSKLPSGLQSPVYDSVSNRILVTDVNTCALYVVDATSGTLLATDSFSCSDQSDVIVDSTNQTAFVVMAAFPSFQLTALQFDTSGVLLRQTGTGSLGGNVNVFSGAFDHPYFSNPSSGSFYFAGAINGIASVYRVGFTGGIMNSSFNGPLALTSTPFTSVPGRLTEIFNPSLPSANDRIFVGIDANCGPSVGGDGDGCIESLNISNGFPSNVLDSYLVSTGGNSLSIGGIVMDNVSPVAQASSIYFQANVFPIVSAFKLTQSGLQ